MTEHHPPRIFKIGTNTIVEDQTMAGRSLDEVRAILAHSYPEVAHATPHERLLEDGTLLIEYKPLPGRKG